jgi:hypothetical protein
MADLMEFWDDSVDVDSVEADTGRGGVIPAGDYMIQLVEQETKATKAGTGIMLNCQYKVVEGEFENRMVFGSFNIRNPNAQAQTIGIAQFKALCLATGVPFDVAKSDTSALLYTPFKATIGFGKTTTEYPDPKNEIKKFHPAGGAAPAATAAKAAPAAAAAKPAAAAPAKAGGLPWQKKVA